MRSDGAGADIHAGRLRCYQQRRSLLGDCADAAAGHVRHVLWLPHLLGLRAGAKCHPAGTGFLLPDAVALGRYLAY